MSIQILDKKEIKGFSDYYINKELQVVSKDKDEPLKEYKTRGYKVVTIINDKGETKFTGKHRMICLAYNYVSNWEDLVVDHLDCDKDNNHPSNLEFVTTKENTHRAIKNGLYSDDRQAIEDDMVITIRKEYIPGANGNFRDLIAKYNLKKSMFYYIVQDEFRTDLPLAKDINPYLNGTLKYKKLSGKLTYENKLEIMRRAKTEKAKDLAKEFDISLTGISMIRRGKFKKPKGK